MPSERLSASEFHRKNPGSNASRLHYRRVAGPSLMSPAGRHGRFRGLSPLAGALLEHAGDQGGSPRLVVRPQPLAGVPVEVLVEPQQVLSVPVPGEPLGEMANQSRDVIRALAQGLQHEREPERSRSEHLKPGLVSHARYLATNAESLQTLTRDGFRNRPRPLPASCLFHP